jgi:hypothetical protein
MKKLLYLLGVGWVIFGIFLPWTCAGDLVSYCSSGIRVYDTNIVYWLNGLDPLTLEVIPQGLVVLLLCLAIVGLILFERDSINRSHIWLLMVATILFFLSVLLFLVIFVPSQFDPRIDGPWVGTGLRMVLQGSVFLFILAIWDYAKLRRKPWQAELG